MYYDERDHQITSNQLIFYITRSGLLNLEPLAGPQVYSQLEEILEHKYQDD